MFRENDMVRVIGNDKREWAGWPKGKEFVLGKVNADSLNRYGHTNTNHSPVSIQFKECELKKVNKITEYYV